MQVGSSKKGGGLGLCQMEPYLYQYSVTDTGLSSILANEVGDGERSKVVYMEKLYALVWFFRFMTKLIANKGEASRGDQASGIVDRRRQ